MTEVNQQHSVLMSSVERPLTGVSKHTVNNGRTFQCVLLSGPLEAVISGKKLGISVTGGSLGQRLQLPLFYQSSIRCGCCNNKCVLVNEAVC